MRLSSISISSLMAALFMVLFSLAVTAQTPTKEQIEQFKRMSPAQQEALARSLGINLKDYEHLLNKGSQTPDSYERQISGRRAPINNQQNYYSDQQPYPGQQVYPTQPTGPGQQGQRTSGPPAYPGQQPYPAQQMDRRSPLFEESGIERTATTGTDQPSLEEFGQPEKTAEELQLFGYDIFNYGAEAFTPAADIPIPANYVLGTGDTLVIQLYGKENTTHTLTINREGQIQFPNIGPITLAGMTFTQANDKIDEVVSQQMIGIKASTTMGPLRTIRVFVLGEALVPGSYVVGSLSTMTNAIFASGGITKIGSLRKIQLKRGGKVITELDLYELLLHGDTSKDSRLLPGDVIFIPPIGKTIGVSGQVKRPAVYELKSEKQVSEALSLAGGLLPTAYLPASRIERITTSGEKTLVNLDISTQSGRSFPLQDADVIQIFSTLDTMRDIVKLEGHVKRPGGFAWRENMRFTDIVPNVDALLANPDIDIGLIQREKKETREIIVEVFSPKAAFNNPRGEGNPLLESRDTIVIFDYETDRTFWLLPLINQLKIQANMDERQQVIDITGSVRFPGEYPMARSMTAHQLVKLAGGFTEGALGTDAEITRYDVDETRETLVMHIELNLQQDDPLMVAGDTLRVKQIPLWKQKESVSLVGEVLHPGTYYILPGETLMDVLNRAGGLTPHAYPEGAVFSREDLRILEQERLEALREQIESDIAATSLQASDVIKTDVDEKEAERILSNIEGVKPLGRMVIDLPEIINNADKHDFQLIDGDVLTVPRYKPSVTVVGEVQYPTSHFYDDKFNAFDYIERSGGTKQNADRKRIYIVKANGQVVLPSRSAWFSSRAKSIDPGDTIIVPLDTDKVDKLTVWGSVTTIMYQAAVGIAALAAF